MAKIISDKYASKNDPIFTEDTQYLIKANQETNPGK